MIAVSPPGGHTLVTGVAGFIGLHVARQLGQVPFRLANVAGPAATVETFAAVIERLLARWTGRLPLPLPDGDVHYSVGRSDEPCPTPLADGLRRFADWFTAYTDAAHAGAHLATAGVPGKGA